MRTRKYYTVSLVLLLTFSGCVWKPEKFVNPKLIVCTTTIVGDAVKQLVGNKYEVKVLMGAGVDPHIYEAKPSDVRALGEARVVIYSGLHLEGKMTDLFERIKNEKEIIAFSNGMDRHKLIKINEHAYDPHAWFDPLIWMSGVHESALKLAAVFPKDSSFIMNNYRKIEEDFLILYANVKDQLSTIKSSQRVLITSHDAFHYFGKAFDVEVLAIQGVSTVAEPGLKDVSNLVNLITTRKIKAIFVESSVSSKSIMAVIEGCQSKGHSVKIGGTLYSDALGDKKSGADTYLKMIRKNVNTLVSALSDNSTNSKKHESKK